MTASRDWRTWFRPSIATPVVLVAGVGAALVVMLILGGGDVPGAHQLGRALGASHRATADAQSQEVKTIGKVADPVEAMADGTVSRAELRSAVQEARIIRQGGPAGAGGGLSDLLVISGGTGQTSIWTLLGLDGGGTSTSQGVTVGPTRRPGNVPTTTQPSTTIPSTTQPPTTVPETTVPDTVVPVTVPDTVPETTVPVTVPDTVPDTTVPVTVPDTVPDPTVPTTVVPPDLPGVTIPPIIPFI